MGGFSLCHRFRRPAGAHQGFVGEPGRKPNQARRHYETRREFPKENVHPAGPHQTRCSQTRRVKFYQTVKRTRPNPFTIVKTVNTFLFLLLVAAMATQAQAPAAVAATNENAAAATNV